MCKCIYCKLHFDRCWLLQKYKFHHRVSIGLYNCHSLPSNLHECQTYILQFSVSVYERLPKEQIRNQLCNVKKGTENQSAVRKICVAEGQIKARGKTDFCILRFCNIKLLGTVFIPSLWSTPILEMAKVYHYIYIHGFRQNRPCVWVWVNLPYFWFLDVDVVQCSLTSHHMPSFWQEAGSTKTGIYSQP